MYEKQRLGNKVGSHSSGDIYIIIYIFRNMCCIWPQGFD